MVKETPTCGFRSRPGRALPFAEPGRGAWSAMWVIAGGHVSRGLLQQVRVRLYQPTDLPPRGHTSATRVAVSAGDPAAVHPRQHHCGQSSRQPPSRAGGGRWCRFVVFTGIFLVTGGAEHLCLPATPPSVTRLCKYMAHVKIWGAGLLS